MGRWLLLLVVAGCSVQVGEQAPAEPDPAPELAPECDGTKYALYCRDFHEAYVMGVPDECAGTPWRHVEGRHEERASGREGCFRVSQALVTCCPE